MKKRTYPSTPTQTYLGLIVHLPQVFLAKGNVPAESYNFFIDILLLTIRDEIAACVDKAYERIAFNEAARMLFFSKPQEMKAYGEKVSAVIYLFT